MTGALGPTPPGVSDAPLTLGTAGHIDHGKTTLIGALTGTDTDRLAEERARGISIELGYARLVLPSGRQLSVVDVPGHERFVRTMVAGASGIDLFLMTVAADDGVMPQTREHARILEALDLHAGVVAVTKSDLADPEVAMLEAAELLPRAEAIPVSVRTGAGVDELLAAIDRAAARVPGRAGSESPARLHVDRSFTIRGAGTVVTGTLWSGAIGRGDELMLMPASRRVRVRGVQVHDRPVPAAPAGQRVAVNLTGVGVGEVNRGDVLVSSNAAVSPTYLIDAQLEFAGEPPEHGDRIQAHHGTRETPARLAWLGGSFWQLRLEQPLVPLARDRLVIRQIAPPDTLGGGMVLDAHPRKHGPSRDLLARLERLARGEPVADGQSDLAARSPEPPRRTAAPLSASALATARTLKQAGYEPPSNAELDDEDLAALRTARTAVRVSRQLHYHSEVLEEIRERLIALAHAHKGSVTLAQLRDELGTSRKFAQALLEHFDSEKLTIRRGDEHVLRRRDRR
jgi:selenocysteine-specific elongation factor